MTGIPTTSKALAKWLEVNRATMTPEARFAGEYLACALDELSLHRKSDKGYEAARANVDHYLIKFIEAWKIPF